MNSFEKISKAIYQFEKSFVILLFGVLFVLSFIQVPMRYLFRTGAGWIPEIIVFCFVTVTLAATSTGVTSGVHIAVDVIVKKLPKKIRWGLDIFVGLCGIVLYSFMGYVTYNFVVYFKEMGMVSIITEIPIWMFLVYLPFAFLFTAFHYIEIFIKNFQYNEKKYEEKFNDIAESNIIKDTR